MEEKKYPQGHFIGMGIAIGVPIGVVFGIILGNMAFIGIGIPFGLSIGVALEEKYRKVGRLLPKDPKTIAKERKAMKIILIVGLLLLVLGVFAYFMAS